MRINQIEIGFVLESLLFSNAGESYMIKAVKCTYKRECYVLEAGDKHYI